MTKERVSQILFEGALALVHSAAIAEISAVAQGNRYFRHLV